MQPRKKTVTYQSEAKDATGIPFYIGWMHVSAHSAAGRSQLLTAWRCGTPAAALHRRIPGTSLQQTCLRVVASLRRLIFDFRLLNY